MGKPGPDMVKAAKLSIASMVNRAVRATYHGIGYREKADIKAAFELPQAEAPMWAHTASKLAVAEVRANLNDNNVVNTSLNLVMIGRADTVGAWEAMAQPFQRLALEAKKPAIDVPVVVAAEEAKR